MHVPLVHPIARNRSGIGAVATTSLAITTTDRRTSRSRVGRGPRAPRDLVRLEALERPLPVTVERRDRGLPRADLRGVGRGPQPAVLADVRVDVMLATERRDLGDGPGRRASEPQGLLGPADALERLELRPKREDEPAVAAARAAA